MSVLVRNELVTPWIFEGSHGARQIASGQVEWVSDEEWATVISAKRGPGALNPLSTEPASRLQTKFDYADEGDGTYQVRYLGQASQTALDTDETWTIKKFAWSVLGDSTYQVGGVQVLESVAWADRASLPWS